MESKRFFQSIVSIVDIVCTYNWVCVCVFQHNDYRFWHLGWPNLAWIPEWSFDRITDYSQVKQCTLRHWKVLLFWNKSPEIVSKKQTRVTWCIMDTWNRFCVHWIPNIKFVQREYNAWMLCIMDTRNWWIPEFVVRM